MRRAGILLPVLAALVPIVCLPAAAGEKTGTVKIGVLTDMSGEVADMTGNGSVQAAMMAAETFGGQVGGRRVEVVFADHQNKVDIASSIARRWYDIEDVDAIFDLANTPIALSVGELSRDKNKVMIPSGVGSTDLTGARCSPNTIHWTWDTYSAARTSVSDIVRKGRKKWFFLTVDFGFGHNVEATFSKFVKEAGAEVVGAVRHPYGASDFGSYLLAAMSSSADVVVLTSAGRDISTVVKQAAEFGLDKKRQELVVPLLSLSVVHALGLRDAQGLISTGSFNWTANATSRSFATELARRNKGIHPDMLQAGVYSSVLNYLAAVGKVGASDGRRVVEQMKASGAKDPLLGDGPIRADGRKIHPVQIYQVKSPSASKEPWDYFEVVGEVPGDLAFRPVGEGGCPLVKSPG